MLSVSSAAASRVLFVPFALHDRAAYTAKFRARLEELGRGVDQLAADATGRRQIETAEAVFVGGGNTFPPAQDPAGGRSPALRSALRALAGMPYLGASAGINLAGPTIRTTNDMPIVEPQRLRRPRPGPVPDQSALPRRRARFDPYG
jgi:dipeptidase E